MEVLGMLLAQRIVAVYRQGSDSNKVKVGWPY